MREDIFQCRDAVRKTKLTRAEAPDDLSGFPLVSFHYAAMPPSGAILLVRDLDANDHGLGQQLGSSLGAWSPTEHCVRETHRSP